MQKESVRKLWLVGIFAAAMGFLEAAVVIYTRALFYPGGFAFPLKGIFEHFIINIELIREFVTILMLVCIGLLAGKKAYEKFAYFLFAFAIWDIFYYIFLKIALNWPASFLTWDLLFLIPWAWAGPVIAPIICAVLFIKLGISIIHFSDEGKKVKFLRREWILFVLGGILVLYTWLFDYGFLILQGLGEAEFMALVSNYIPRTYNWGVFFLGILLAAAGLRSFFIRYYKTG